MKAFLAIAVIIAAVAAVLVVMHFFPTSKPPAPTPVAPPAQTGAAPTPVEVVTSYLGALQKKDYRGAYEQLSKASQQAHAFDEFVKLNEKGMTVYDLASAKQEPDDKGFSVVSVNLQEDVSGNGFHLTREGGRWKVVFLQGTPSYPYAE